MTDDLAARLAAEFGAHHRDDTSWDVVKEKLKEYLAAGVDRQVLIDIYMEIMLKCRRDGDEEREDDAMAVLDVLTGWVVADRRI